MVTTARKLGLSLALFLFSFPACRLSGWFSLGIPVGFVLSILYWFDVGRELRALPPDRRGARVLGLLMGVPQALFGLVCAGAGIAIVGWVLYNSLWHRDPHYTGSFMSFGIGPLLGLFGAGMVWGAFRRAPAGAPAAEDDAARGDPPASPP